MPTAQEYIRELERREKEEKERAKEEQRREERKARDAFKELLTKHRWGLLQLVSWLVGWLMGLAGGVRRLGEVRRQSTGGVGGSSVVRGLLACSPHTLFARSPNRELGLITVKTRWKEYAPAVKAEEAYLAVGGWVVAAAWLALRCCLSGMPALQLPGRWAA